jgi:hypothetical protein
VALRARQRMAGHDHRRCDGSAVVSVEAGDGRHGGATAGRDAGEAAQAPPVRRRPWLPAPPRDR